MEIIWRGFIYGSKLDIYKRGVPSSFHPPFPPPQLPFLTFCCPVLSFDLWLLCGFISVVIIPSFNLFFFPTLIFFSFLDRFGGAEVGCLAQNICGKKIPRSSEGEWMIVSLFIWDVPWMENLICIHGTDRGIAVASNNYYWQRPGNAFYLFNSTSPHRSVGLFLRHVLQIASQSVCLFIRLLIYVFTLTPMCKGDSV